MSEFSATKAFRGSSRAIANPPEGKELPRTRILPGGNVATPGEDVEPGFLTAVKSPASLVARLGSVKGKRQGRRALLADWLASPDNPLTPRVFVNRVWQYHLGAGIVATSGDFGVNGSGASHPELLDYLAGRFIDGGWRLKPLHRLIVLSRTYRTSTVHPGSESCEKVDPENRLLWRAHYRRLEAEALRDALLAVSGRLRTAMGGPGFFEEIPDEMGRNFPFFKWLPSDEEQRRRRSLYIFQRRNLVVPMLEAFDSADPSQSCERRRTSVTTPQVFHLLNGRFAVRASRHFAERVIREVGSDRRAQVERIFRLAFARPPGDKEMDVCRRLLAEQLDDRRRVSGADRTAQAESYVEALADLCLVVFNANEFLYLE